MDKPMRKTHCTDVVTLRTSSSDGAPRISVVIPVYNRRETIKAAIHSVLSQTFNDFELIVVDDGSTDETLSEVMSISDTRITVLQQSNNGPSSARNVGVMHSKAPILAFHDSDDIWLPNKLERQIECFSTESTVASYCGMIVLNGSRKNDHGTKLIPENYFPRGNIVCPLLKSNFISTQTLLVRRETFFDSGLFDVKLRALEDWDLALRLSALGEVEPVCDHLVLQRFSSNSLSLDEQQWAKDHQTILHKHSEILRLHPKGAERQWQIVAGRHRKVGSSKEAKAALLEGMKYGNLDFRFASLYLLSTLPVIKISAFSIIFKKLIRRESSE
jgi:glycosyltransferase involved in cell wall biosynthesis